MPRPVSTPIEKNLKVLFEGMPQPHKYRHSNPVHGNEIISALTLLPGQKPAAHAGQEPPEEPKPADPTTSNRQSSWKPGRQTRAKPTQQKRTEAQSSRPKIRRVGKTGMSPEAKHPRNRRRSYKDPRPFCKAFVDGRSTGRRDTEPHLNRYGNGRPRFEGKGDGDKCRLRQLVPPS